MRLAALIVLMAAALVLSSAAGSTQRTIPAINAYRGLATWVDIYDSKAWRNPERAVRGMKARRVRTLFIETANYRQPVDVVRPAFMGRFLDAAHARGLKVVAWYLPSFAKPKRDLRRALAAIQFESATGEQFDSFALDIEASVVKKVPLRNRRLLTLSARIRDAVGTDYALGAIIPSPRGMQLLPKYWPGFPYAELALTYDVFLPMGYFSYRPGDLGGPYGYTLRNVALIRSGTGDSNVLVHAIGGLSESSSGAQVRAFVRATRDCGVIGASMYDYSTTGPAGWKQLRRVRYRPLPSRPSCF